MLEIYVDADACPVKQEIERVADRHDFTVYMASISVARHLAVWKRVLLKICRA